MKTNETSFSAAKNNFLKTIILAAFVMPGVATAADDEATMHKEGVHVIPETAHHTVTANVGLFSNYLYRGISQTGTKPAIQGGMDYAHSSGLYAGVWGSNISWLSDAGVADNASLELDTYAGFKSGFADDFSYDVGFLRYNYPGTYAVGATKADTNEIYGALGWKWLIAKYSHSLGDTFGMLNAKGTSYIELNASYSIADTGVALGAHFGKQTYKGTTADALAAAGTTATYTDYKLSASKDFSGYVLGLAYSSTNAKTGAGQFYYALGNDLGKGTAVLSLTHAM
jgi:uncharacterized protein (TIGR02001 family)